MTTTNGMAAFIARLAVLLLCLSVPQVAVAQDPPKPADPAPDPDKVTLNFFKGTEVGGLVDTYYLWNSTKMAPLFHAFDSKHNSFDVSMAELWLTKAPAKDSPIGYKVRLNFGSAPDIMASASGQFAAESPYKNIGEAYGSYLAPVGEGLQIDVGKFVTNAGAEVIEAKDDWNYTRSLLFQLAIPVYHAGIRLTYSPNSKVTLMGGVVNGWSDVSDNNTGKSVMASVTLKPTAGWQIIENYIGGPEQPAESTDWRTLSDTVIIYTVNPTLSLMANYDYTHDTVLGKTNTTQGVAGYLKYQANKWVAVVPRVEYFNDAQGAPWATGTVQNLTEATVTLEVKPADNFVWRIEYRGDWSNTSPFLDSSGKAQKNQQSLVFGFLFSFSSKS
jgi:hypothetical protein